MQIFFNFPPPKPKIPNTLPLLPLNHFAALIMFFELPETDNTIKRSPLYKGKKKKKSKKKRKKYPDLSNNPGPYFCACCAGLNLMQVTCERGSKM